MLTPDEIHDLCQSIKDAISLAHYGQAKAQQLESRLASLEDGDLIMEALSLLVVSCRASGKSSVSAEEMSKLIETILAAKESSPSYFIFGARDLYHSSGQVGAMGPNSHVHDLRFEQLWTKRANHVDLAMLANDLELLRSIMKGRAQSLEEYAILGRIADAEMCARNGNGPATLMHLCACGKSVEETAREINANVAVTVLALLGLNG